MTVYSDNDRRVAEWMLVNSGMRQLCASNVNRTKTKDDAARCVHYALTTVGPRTTSLGYPITLKGIRLAMTEM